MPALLAASAPAFPGLCRSSLAGIPHPPLSPTASEPRGFGMDGSCGVPCSLFGTLPGPSLECANTQAVRAKTVYYVFIGCCHSGCQQSKPALMLPQKRAHNHQSWGDLSPWLLPGVGLGTDIVPYFCPDPRMAANQQRPASPSPARQATASPAWATGRATTATPRCLPATPCSPSPLLPPTLRPGKAWQCSAQGLFLRDFMEKELWPPGRRSCAPCSCCGGAGEAVAECSSVSACTPEKETDDQWV